MGRKKTKQPEESEMPAPGTKKPTREKPAAQPAARPGSPAKQVHTFRSGQQVMVVNAKGENGPYQIQQCLPQSYIVLLVEYGRVHVDSIRLVEGGEGPLEPPESLQTAPEPKNGQPAPKAAGTPPGASQGPAGASSSDPPAAPAAPSLVDILSGVNLQDCVGTRWKSVCGNYVVIHILKEKESADYLCVKLGPGMYRLTKLKREEEMNYVVRVGKERACWCIGWKNHGKCKHLAAIEKLLEEKRIS